MSEPKKVYKRLLEKAKEEGFDHSGIVHIIRNRIAVTEAELEAAKAFFKWVLEDIEKRYKDIGGKTYRFGKDMLYPKELAEQRMGLNTHLWNEEGYIRHN